MTDIRYCDTCKHFRPASGHSELANLEFGRCIRGPRNPDAYLSARLDIGGYASVLRGAERLCGPAAAWFEPIEEVAP